MKTHTPRSRSSPIRMLDVAVLAKVSPMTVSRALRFPDTVSDKTRNRVVKAVTKLGYIPNQLASSLRTFSRTKVMGLIVPSVRNAIFADSLKGLSDELQSHGFSLMLADSNYSPAQEEKLIRAFLAQQPRAMVLFETVHTKAADKLLRSAHIPIVEIGTLTTRPIDMLVSYSNYLAAKAMTEHLIRKGHKIIAFVSLSTKVTRPSERLHGYKAALKEAGLPVVEEAILETEGGYSAGATAMAQLLDSGIRVDAAFFAGDVLAIGALFECQRRGMKVPGEVAIAGFDDLEVASQMTPTLTALRIPRYQIGKHAAHMILDRLKGENTLDKCFDVGFEIIERDSA